MKLFYSDDYVACDYEFDSTRKPKWIAESLIEHPIGNVEIVAPSPLTEDQISRFHSPDYVKAIKSGEPRELAESNCFKWDPKIWRVASSQNGGVVASAREAIQNGVSGSLSTGLHHAYASNGKGFCSFNGLAIAANLLTEEGHGPILIIDLDAHCGGGTHSMIKQNDAVWQLDVSTSNFDLHPDTERSKVHLVYSPENYLPKIRNSLAELSAEQPDFKLCLYFSGMDPHEDCAFGGRPGFTDELISDRESLVFEWCRAHSIPVAFFLGGGYTGKRMTQEQLVNLHRLTISYAVAFSK